MGLDMSRPAKPLRAVNPATERRECYKGKGFIYDQESGEAEWNYLDLSEDAVNPLRITLHPDEGSALYSAVMFLLSKDCLIHLQRDELYLVQSWT